MQIYTDYNLMRSVLDRLGWVILICFSSYAYADVEINEHTPPDSLYSQWNKSDHKSQPYFAYSIANFNDLGQIKMADEMISSYGVGSIFISNGYGQNIQSWITKVNETTRVQPFFAANLTTLFELPFSTETKYPTAIEILCLTDDSMAYQLGVDHGLVLMEMGFDVLNFAGSLTKYSDSEWQKAQRYIEGIRESGLYFSFDSQNEKMAEMVGWDRVLLYEQSTRQTGKGLIKFRKEFEKSTGFGGLYKADLQPKRGFDKKHNQLTEETHQILMTSSSMATLMNQPAYSKHSIRAEKKAARTYFKLWKKVKFRDRPLLPMLDRVEFLTNVQLLSKVLIRDRDQLLPMGNLIGRKVFTVFDSTKSAFEANELVDRYKTATHLTVDFLRLPMDSILKLIPFKSMFLLDVSAISDETTLQRIDSLQMWRNMIVLYRGGVDQLSRFDYVNTLLWSADKSSQSLIDQVQMAFGAEPILGQLPGYMSGDFSRTGELRNQLTRMKYKHLRDATVDTTRLFKIDSIVYASIKNQEMPGCQIMMIHKGNVVYDKSFGYLTYDSLHAVRWDNLYDIASVTKTTATVPMVMHAVERDLIHAEDQLGDYFVELVASNKAKIRIANLLNHESGLKSYYPFWRNASYDTTAQTFLYKRRKSTRRRAYEYLNVNWEDSVNTWIGQSDYNRLINPDSTFRYLYSDLNFMLLKQMIERKTSIGLDQLTDSLIFGPMGMDHTYYNPTNKMAAALIAPTEDDHSFRNRLLTGEVHDKNAALLGGVAGHAGLFSNANDLAKYMQMMLRYGEYGGVRYFDSLTVKTFATKTDETHRRALGWDKPSKSVANVSKYASDASFGHSGFTGTLVWADPTHDMVYIFLSNRIHPDPQNYKLIENNTRTRIHDVMYESILSQDNPSIHDM